VLSSHEQNYEMADFYDVERYSMADNDRRFIGHSDDGGNKLVWNVVDI
jgi:hypothetical protein